MKILRIKDNKGQFLCKPFEISGLPSDDNYKDVDLIEKEDILELITYMIDHDIEMDPYNLEGPLPNPVLDLIYRNLFTKFQSVDTNKTVIKKEVDDKFAAAENKYNE